MHIQKIIFLVINLVFGALVPLSYIYGLRTHPGQGALLWGGVPAGWRPLYTVNIFLAALGYLAFTGFIFFCLDPETVRIGRSSGFGLFNMLYLAILIPSALWMSLTFAMIANPNPQLWRLVRLDLVIVGLAALLLLWALWVVAPREPHWAHILALIGALFFCLQTTVLDMIVWTVYYPFD